MTHPKEQQQHSDPHDTTPGRSSCVLFRLTNEASQHTVRTPGPPDGPIVGITVRVQGVGRPCAGRMQMLC